MGKKIKIVFLDRATFPENIKIIKPKIPHELIEYNKTNPSQVISRCREAEVILTNKVAILKKDIQKLPQLQLISVTATGTDNIDHEACRQNNIMIANVVNYGTDSVAEHCWCLILNLFRQFIPYRNSVLKNQWTKSKKFCYFLEPVREVAGKRIGIIGPGILGKRVGELAKAFKMETVYVGNPYTINDKKYRGLKFVSLDNALKNCDVITVHCPLTEKTRNLITFKEFKKMKPNSFLINTSRGGIINEADLAIALKKKMIGGAAFDVLSIEPPPPNHILHRLKENPQLILTPHIAWIGENSVNNLINLALLNVEKFYYSKKNK